MPTSRPPPTGREPPRNAGREPHGRSAGGSSVDSTTRSSVRPHERVLDTIQNESGKTRRDALVELLTVAGTLSYYLAHGRRILAADRRRSPVPGLVRVEVDHKPHGLVGMITPWNYPFLLGIADALPALLAGNAVLSKPSEITPLSTELARELLIEGGLDADLVAVGARSGRRGRPGTHRAGRLRRVHRIDRHRSTGRRRRRRRA